eukprot:m.149634 g.149634  ORF g.149634 m.149634 type:complete len:654 (+) comp11672_c0_seq2:1188-3149(+)
MLSQFVGHVARRLAPAPVRAVFARDFRTCLSYKHVIGRAWASTSTLEARLKKRYDERSTSGSMTGLFQTWQTYETSLPVRIINKSNEWLKLHKVPYWCAVDDVRRMAGQLAYLDGQRKLAKYVCSPSSAGKTSSIIPAFLEGDFTHYLYLAFANNNNRNFVVDPPNPNSNNNVAEEQGAAFAVECMRILLEEPHKEGPYKVPRDDNPPPVKDSRDALTQLLIKHLGEDSQPLIHVDEHKRMCNHNKTVENDPGASFSRGAMEALAYAHTSTLVATFTEPPPLSPFASSKVCRHPVALPRVDIDEVMQYLANDHPVGQRYPGLCFPTTATRNEIRLLATLRLRFAMYIDTRLSGLHRPGTLPCVDNFVDDLANALSGGDCTETTLENAIQVCPVVKPRNVQPNDHAAKLLLGMVDEEADQIGRNLTNLILLPNEMVSSTIPYLVSTTDPNVDVYNNGADRFLSVLREQGNDTKLLYSAPLEEAYLWTLSCRGALHGFIRFHRKTFKMRCRAMESGRIFPGTATDTFKDVSTLESGVMYYADEGSRGGDCSLSHPRADMWFRGSLEGKDVVVLIDITGGGGATVTRKAKKLTETIQEIQAGRMENDVTVHGVILAPADTGASATTKDGRNMMMIVRGRDARNLLGGLDQLFRYIT